MKRVIFSITLFASYLFHAYLPSLSPAIAEDSPAGSLRNEDFTQIVRGIIDHPRLQDYFHEGLPGRTPLRILKREQFPETLLLNKFGQAVVYLESKDLQGEKAYLDFEKFSIHHDHAIVDFKYPIEGISGKAELVRQSGTWQVKKLDVIERKD